MADTKQQTARKLNWCKYMLLGMEAKFFTEISSNIRLSDHTTAQFKKAFASLRRDIRRAEREAGILAAKDW